MRVIVLHSITYVPRISIHKLSFNIMCSTLFVFSFYRNKNIEFVFLLLHGNVDPLALINLYWKHLSVISDASNGVKKIHVLFFKDTTTIVFSEEIPFTYNVRLCPVCKSYHLKTHLVYLLSKAIINRIIASIRNIHDVICTFSMVA